MLMFNVVADVDVDVGDGDGDEDEDDGEDVEDGDDVVCLWRVKECYFVPKDI